MLLGKTVISSNLMLCTHYAQALPTFLIDLPSIEQNQQDFSSLNPQQPAHQPDYPLTFSQIIVHILGICQQRNKHPHQLYRRIHFQESAKTVHHQINTQSITCIKI